MGRFTSRAQGFSSRICHWVCKECGVVFTVKKPGKCTHCGTVGQYIYIGSKHEFNRYNELKLLERSGHIDEGTLELQPKYEIMDNDNKRTTRLDFRYSVHGVVHIEDAKTKGTDTVESRRIRALVEKQHGITVILV
jgi:hypothetical protein